MLSRIMEVPQVSPALTFSHARVNPGGDLKGRGEGRMDYET